MNGTTHAAGQLQGYLLQVRHMLFELISYDDLFVSLEKLDDVAVESPDGLVITEQLKSVTSDNNPITNRSIVFWKTLYNWLTYVHNGTLTLDNTIFRMIVASNRKIETGDIIQQFNAASTVEEANNALNTAKLTILGKDSILKKEVPESYGNYLDVLFSPDNHDLVTRIIVHFSLVIHENDYDEKLIKKFNGQVIFPEFAENLFTYMLGWVNEKVNEYLKQGLPAVIASTDYRRVLTTQSRMYSQQNAIPMLSTEIASDEVLTEVESQDVYIQQLGFIEMDFDGKLEAASDYLRTKAETTIRADKGLFAPQSLHDYHDKVRRLWRNKREQTLLFSTDSDITKGKQLYMMMSEAAITLTLSDISLPSFFGSGTLHTLANEPRTEPQIGWHPNYRNMLKGGIQDE